MTELPADTSPKPKRYGFVIDNRRCIGCHACTVACKQEHNTPVGVNRTWLKYVEKGTFPHSRRVFSVHRCNHCSDAPCVDICPVRSLFVRPDGIVDFDSQRCIGCKACMQACPYDALHIDPHSHTSTKCNYCAHRVDGGMEPACVVVCPVQAIISGDINDPNSRISLSLSRTAVSVRKPEKNTQPRLFYIDGDTVSLRPEMAPPSTQYAQSAQSAGVGRHALHQPLQGALALPFGAEQKKATHPTAQTATNTPDSKGAMKATRTYDTPQRGVLWGWEVGGYLWTKSIAAGAVLTPLLLHLLAGLQLSIPVQQALGAISLIFMGLTGVLLVKDLTMPQRFLYVILRPQWRSWLTRGAYILLVFEALLSAWWGWLWVMQSTAPVWLMWCLCVAAFMAAVYTALLFAQAKGRDHWQNSAAPLRMALAALGNGAATALLLGLLLGVADHTLFILSATTMGVLVVHVLLVGGEFKLAPPTHDAAMAHHHLLRGQLCLAFWGSVVFGLLFPIVLFALVMGGMMPAVLGIGLASVSVLIFSLGLEQVMVRAPQLVPLA